MSISALDNAALDAIAIQSDACRGEQVLRRVFEFVGRFVCYPCEHSRVAHTLWCAHAHLMSEWEATPRLAFLSAEPASGKSRALEITELLVPNAVNAVNVSPAYLFRKIGGEEQATILFDEIDTVFGPKAKENEEIRGLLNAGHRRGAMVGRCVVRGKEIVPVETPAYAAVALAGLGWLPDTILTRSVIVRMRKRLPSDRVEPFRPRLHRAEGWEVREALSLWAASVAGTIEWPDMPALVVDRDADSWEPLIAVADAAGGEWPDRARAAAVALVSASKDREPSLGVLLLQDVRKVFGTGSDHLTSMQILAALNAMPESPWAALRTGPLDARGLSTRLREYGIRPKTIRTGPAETLRGYARNDFLDAWARYAPSPEDAETSKTPETTPTELDPNEWSFNLAS